MSSPKKVWFRLFCIILVVISLNACVVFPLEESDTNRSLYWCLPLHNCASTEALTFVHSIPPFELKIPLEQAWPIIKKAVANLTRTKIEHQYYGYLYAKTHSKVFNFVDYVEVLAVPEEHRLNVRSSSMLGLTDMFVNYLRTEDLRKALEQKGVIVITAP